MANDWTILNPGTNGDAMDEAGISYPSSPTTRKRPRVVISGENRDDLVSVNNSDPAQDAYAVAVRSLPRAIMHPGSPIAQYDNVTAVPASSETTIVDYTVPVGGTFYFIGFAGSGDINGKYIAYLDGNATLVARSTAAFLNVDVELETIRPTVAAGQTVSIKITHYQTGLSGSFDGTILGYLVS